MQLARMLNIAVVGGVEICVNAAAVTLMDEIMVLVLCGL